MAGPISTTVLAAKAAVTALSDERLRKTIGWTLGLILSPVILLLVLICSLLSCTADHTVGLCFDGGVFRAMSRELPGVH